MNRADLEEQHTEARIRCPVCDDPHIVEKPTAPAIHVPRRTRQLDAQKQRESEEAKSVAGESQAPNALGPLRAMVEAVRQVVEESFEDVGPHFADEAVSIYLGDSEERPIRGTATEEEEADLQELGIEFNKVALPRFDD